MNVAFEVEHSKIFTMHLGALILIIMHTTYMSKYPLQFVSTGADPEGTLVTTAPFTFGLTTSIL